MGVYIKGMEMPKEYGPHEITITFFVRDDGTASLWGKEVFIPHEPLEVIPIPPHGDLIDRDALPWEKQSLMVADEDWALPCILIGDAPTIIPAEPERTPA